MVMSAADAIVCHTVLHRQIEDLREYLATRRGAWDDGTAEISAWLEKLLALYAKIGRKFRLDVDASPPLVSQETEAAS